MSVFLRKYNTLTVTGTTAIRIPMIKRGVVDFAVGADWTPAAGDVKILVDGTAATNVTNLPTAVASGNGAVWEFVLTAAELSCKQAVITIVDSATKAVEDQAFIVETYGNASAMYQADLSAANLPANVAQWNGSAVASPATAGVPDVNVKNVNNVSAGSVTTVNANQGTTQPVNFTGTGASALAKSDMIDVAGAAVSTSSAQIGVNVVTNGDKTGYALTSAYDPAKTAAQPGDSMALTSGERTTLTAVIWNALTSGFSTVGSIGKLIKDDLDAAISSVAASSATAVWAAGTRTLTSFGTLVSDIWAAVADSSGVTTLLARLTSTRAGLLDHLDADISSRTKPSDTQAAVTTVTNLTNAPTVGDFTATMKGSITTAASSSTPALSTAGNAAVADKFLGRGIQGGADGGRTVTDALRNLRNKAAIVAGIYTVYQEDDATPAYTAAVATDPAAEPIVSVDPV